MPNYDPNWNPRAFDVTIRAFWAGEGHPPPMPPKKILLRLICAPADAVAALIVLFVWACWGHKLQIKHGVLCCELKPESWPQRTWYALWGATTFGHAIMFAKGYIDWDPIWQHELVHVEQYESESVQQLFALVLFVSVGYWWVGLLWCAFAPLLAMFSGFVTAWLRGENFYAGSHLEEAARAAVCCRVQSLKGPA